MARRRDGDSRWAQRRPAPASEGWSSQAPAVPPGTAGTAPSGPPATRSPAGPSTRSTRAQATLVAGAVVLVVTLIFILQNLKSTRVSFLFVHWKLPLALDLLLATVFGGAVVLAATSVRAWQSRRTDRHDRD